LVLTGNGDAFSAGMDLREFFRAQDGLPYVKAMRVRRSAPHLAMGAARAFREADDRHGKWLVLRRRFTPLVACDLAIAADEATFGLSEINWGIIPGGAVTKACVATMSLRDAMYYILTGETFDGKKAAQMRLVNEVRSESQAA